MQTFRKRRAGLSATAGLSCCLQLKEIVADAFSVPLDRLCLIYGGEILRDPETVQKYGIKDGGIVHVVVKNPRPVCILHFQFPPLYLNSYIYAIMPHFKVVFENCIGQCKR